MDKWWLCSLFFFVHSKSIIACCTTHNFHQAIFILQKWLILFHQVSIVCATFFLTSLYSIFTSLYLSNVQVPCLHDDAATAFGPANLFSKFVLLLSTSATSGPPSLHCWTNRWKLQLLSSSQQVMPVTSGLLVVKQAFLEAWVQEPKGGV